MGPYYDNRSLFEKPSTWVLGAAAAVALGYGGCNAANNKVIGDRIHEGHIVSFGPEGFFFKTYEGTMAQGGSDRSINVQFSLDRQARNGENIPDLVAKLEDAQRTQSPILIREREVYSSFPWRSNSRKHVYSVEPVGRSPTSLVR